MNKYRKLSISHLSEMKRVIALRKIPEMVNLIICIKKKYIYIYNPWLGHQTQKKMKNNFALGFPNLKVMREGEGREVPLVFVHYTSDF